MPDMPAAKPAVLDAHLGMDRNGPGDPRIRLTAAESINRTFRAARGFLDI